MLSMQLSKRFVQQIVLDGFAFVGIRNNLLDCYKCTMRRRKLRVVEKARKVIFMVTPLDRGCLEP